MVSAFGHLERSIAYLYWQLIALQLGGWIVSNSGGHVQRPLLAALRRIFMQKA
jgi:hypothetical protein